MLLQTQAIIALHVVAFVVCLAASLIKTILLRKGFASAATARQMVRLNKLTAISAGVSGVSGVLLLFWSGRGPQHYLSQPFFLAKLALFIAVSALVLRAKPFFRQAAAVRGVTEVPLKLRLFLLADLCALPIIGMLGRWIATH